MKKDKELKPVVIIGENDLATTHPKIFKSLDRKLNNVMHVDIKTLTEYSDDYVYLWCEKMHLYMAKVCKAVDGSAKCPFCEGRHEYPEGKTIIVEEKDKKGNKVMVEKINPLYVAREKRLEWLEKEGKEL